MPKGFRADDRIVLRVSGPEAHSFLQGIVTSDVRAIDKGPVYSALLSPQGKYLFDFFLFSDGEAGVLLEVKADRAAALLQRLSLYRLRARVVLEETEIAVVVGLGDPAPLGAVDDPRDRALGWRLLTREAETALAGLDPLDPADWHALRVAHGVPETGIELVPDDTYILEAGFERLGGVDFKKGCYVGQEVVARMKHKTELRKGLVSVRVAGEAPPPGTPIFSGERRVGTLYSVARGVGLAHLRLDRVGSDLVAEGVRIERA